MREQVNEEKEGEERRWVTHLSQTVTGKLI